jgi:hypothetical protein
MKFVEWIEDEVAALAVSAIAAFVAAIGAWFLTIFIGAKFVRDEWGYGVALLFGLPAALFAGVAAFIVVFGKIRSL